MEEQRAENGADLPAEPHRPVVTVHLDRTEHEQSWPGALVHRRRSSVRGGHPEPCRHETRAAPERN
ncbi:hypothetical protein Skr01_73020 [Sphaerisporangium krabiense]|nr:hypothetical protein Skr01_73020 [Sphaerisporangium krabiense]